MGDRGTYSNGRSSTNGHSHRALGQPILGGEASSLSREALGLGSFLLALGLGAFTGHRIAQDSSKGAALGLVGGFFAYYVMDQASSLRRINEQLAQIRYRSP